MKFILFMILNFTFNLYASSNIKNIDEISNILHFKGGATYKYVNIRNNRYIEYEYCNGCIIFIVNLYR